MSVYFVEKKGWRYDFMLKGQRYTKAWFQTKREAKQAEEEQRKYLMTPTPTDMPFLVLVNKRLDEVRQRLSSEHYMDTVLPCQEMDNALERYDMFSNNEGNDIRFQK